LINFNNNDKLINKVKPYLIFTGTIHADEGCPLYEDMRSGKFNECTIGEYIAEKELLLNLIDIPCYYFGLHPSNVVPVHGILPQNKKALLSELQDAEETFGEEKLKSIPRRVSEGAIV